MTTNRMVWMAPHKTISYPVQSVQDIRHAEEELRKLMEKYDGEI